MSSVTYNKGTRWTFTVYANVINVPLTITSYDSYVVCVLKSGNKNSFANVFFIFLITFHVRLAHKQVLTIIEPQFKNLEHFVSNNDKNCLESVFINLF